MINNNNNFYDIKKEIITILETIIKLLRKKNIKSKIIEKIINNTITILGQNIKNFNKINISDEKEYIENYNKIIENNVDLKKNDNNYMKESEIPIYCGSCNNNKNISNINNNKNINSDINYKTKNDFSSINIYSNYNNNNNKICNNIVQNETKHNKKNSIYENGITSTKKNKSKKKKEHSINKQKKQDNKPIPISFNYENIMCPPVRNSFD